MDDGHVLIVGQRPDPHIDAVAQSLKALGHSSVIFDRWSPTQGITIELGGHGRTGGRIHTVNGDIDFTQISSVWWRVKPVRLADFGFQEGNIEEAFARREWMEVLHSLPELLTEVSWVNVVAHQSRAARKPWQLALAHQMGLVSPETIITNQSASILNGFEPHTPLVYKTLSSFIRPPDEIVFTNRVTRKQIRDAEPEIAIAPCIFQRKLAKRHEIRVTIVAEQVFAVGIDSQSDTATKIDWRHDQGRAMYFKTELSSEVQRRLLAFHRNAGLVFATYDFIVTPKGEEVFLECNPGGQWLWLERALKLEISSCLATVLAKGRTAAKQRHFAIASRPHGDP